MYSFYLKNPELSKKKLQLLCKYCHIEKSKEEIKEVSKYLEILWFTEPNCRNYYLKEDEEEEEEETKHKNKKV